ncbi:ankyrin repeat domain-containing protein [Saccharicrinis sp. FJH62]|uniref:ankyrin repeat domain-containing protein n=1 Tax=Saccharicrinis sp. FJH62 TaxID=3344657 RepID=UPI0035D4A000
MKKPSKSLLKLTSFLILFTAIVFTSCNGKSGSKNEKNSRPSAPVTTLHAAAFMGDISAVRQHIAAGTSLNAKDQYGSTPLTIAATFGKTEVAKQLMNAGADTNMKNNEGSTPLHVAAFFCRTEIVKELLDHGADKTIKNNTNSTALEIVSVPFADVKVVYDYIGKELGPLGLKLDYDYLEKTRPVIAKMLE